MKSDKIRGSGQTFDQRNILTAEFFYNRLKHLTN